MFLLQVRKKITINTDPQKRCYNGCHYSSEEVWTEWEPVCSFRLREDAEESIRVFKKINPSREYRICVKELNVS